MKIFLFFIFIFYLLSVCFPQVTNPVVICTVKFNDKPLEGVSVLVKGTIEESELLTTGSAGKVNLTLNINDNYRVEIFKPGFIKQRIEISTKIIGSIDGFLPYNINLSLFRMFTGLDTSFFRKSLFKFQIDSKKKVFEEDLAYKNVLKKDFEAFKKKYDFALNNDIIFNTKAGDKELAENRYEDAWLFYDKAFQLKDRKSVV